MKAIVPMIFCCSCCRVSSTACRGTVRSHRDIVQGMTSRWLDQLLLVMAFFASQFTARYAIERGVLLAVKGLHLAALNLPLR